jgi:hypothetical protein
MNPTPPGCELGRATVVATSNGGHTPEQWCEMLMNKIMYISDGCPDAIKSQAYEFKGAIANEILQHMKQAIKSDRLTVCHLLRQAGQSEVADYIWSMS